MKEQTLYIARDENGTLVLYPKKPKKDIEGEMWLSNENEESNFPFIILRRNQFPNVKWEDKKPTRVILREVK